jgi:alcohol dehydrogenase class IV
MEFIYESHPQRVRLKSGGAAEGLRAEVEIADAQRVMVVAAAAEEQLADEITAGLPVALRWNEVVMHVPVEVAERARAAAKSADVDLLVSVGGGSTTGLAKAIALTSGVPIVAVATTYAGSEATNVWGLTTGTKKTTGVDGAVLPRCVIYDAALTTTLPVEMSVASGLNALAHCIDSMWAANQNPVADALAAEGIRALATGLPQVVAEPHGLAGREHALYAAYLSAVSFSSAGGGLHHKICHALGGKYNLPHAQTHAVVLPYVLAFNGGSALAAERRIAGALGSATAVDGLASLYKALDAPHALRDYGFEQSEFAAAAGAILPSVPPSNPRLVTAKDLEQLLAAAWEGADPHILSEPQATLKAEVIR